MIIRITDPKIREAIDLVSSRSRTVKRILSPDPENEPYWHHLVRVYYWLVQYGETDQNLLLAAILHDSVEDDQVTIDEIIEIFGDDVSEIVQLLTEKIHTDHNSSVDRAYYFQEIDNHPNPTVRKKAVKIKISDRFDNLIGLSYTNLELKKDQYRREIAQFFRRFAYEVGMTNFIENGLSILNGELKPPEILLEIEFSEEIYFK